MIHAGYDGSDHGSKNSHNPLQRGLSIFIFLMLLLLNVATFISRINHQKKAFFCLSEFIKISFRI